MPNEDDDGDDAENIPEVEADASEGGGKKEDGGGKKEDGGGKKEEGDDKKEEGDDSKDVKEDDTKEVKEDEAKEVKEDPPAEEVKEEPVTTNTPTVLEEVNKIVEEVVTAITDLPNDVNVESESKEVTPTASVNPTIYIDTKPSVSFSNDHVMFDSENLENNEIYDIPFAEAELREDEEIDSLVITNDVLTMDADEILP